MSGADTSVAQKSAGNLVCITMASGCPRSKCDLARLFPYFHLNGWRVTDRLEDADLIVINSCGFSEKAEDECVQVLRSAGRRSKENARVVVVGCLAAISPDRLRQAWPCEPVGPLAMDQLDAIAGGNVPLSAVGEVNDFGPMIQHSASLIPPRQRAPLRQRIWPPGTLAEKVMTRVRRLLNRNVDPSLRQRTFHVRIARGCLGECTYCAIRKAEGSIQSRPIDAIVTEFRTGLARGFRHFDLLAGDTGAYGQDIGGDLPALLARLLDEPGDYVIDLPDLNPRWVVKYRRQFLEQFARAGRRIGMVLMPIESGSDRVLELMKRGHMISDAIEVMNRIIELCPHCNLQTQVIVGFPGETEDDFQRTLAALNAVRFTRITAWCYSERPDTEAVSLPDKVPAGLAWKRLKQVRSQFSRQYKW